MFRKAHFLLNFNTFHKFHKISANKAEEIFTPSITVIPPLFPQILAALPYDWSGGRLLFFSCLRVVFIPLFVMCVYPANAPTLSHPAWPCLFSLLMGVTNGYFGSVPMIQAAGKVPPEQRELAGKSYSTAV